MENLYQSILDNLYEGVYLIDASRVVTYWNKSAERITGFKAGEIIGKYCNDSLLSHMENENTRMHAAACPVHRTLLDGKRREANVCLRHRNGQHVEVSVKTMPLFERGEIIGAAEVFTEALQKKAAAAAASPSEDASLHDVLTGLPNRRYIDFYLKNRLAELENLDISFAAIMADIDCLQEVNDAYGMEVGDRIIKMVAKAMRGAFRKNDFIGRWSGEEFLVVIVGVSEDDLNLICEKIRNLVKHSTLRMEHESIGVTISIGSTIARRGDTPSSLQDRIAGAVRASKSAGRDLVTIL